MSVLPSPVPHPLDYSPWELPGWIYEALDWVVGVEWPEGDERAVWDLADQWYAVATALAGPRADAVAAAGDVRSGHGGAVGEAFDAAWRRLAEGDDAPLPVLLAVSSDLGRMVEECGCDIEGAKLEVWIELGILVVELLSLAVAAVLTAGAASPAAGPAVMASRMIVQQIMRRLTGQLARKSLKHGLREAGERAARQVAEGGVRGLARRAAVGGLAEAAEESGVSLATQAYQNTTGRRHGLDLTDLGASALGGLAGGAAAPLAGLGGHATGRGARVGEHLGREMAGEVIAETAAGLATGQGPISLEDAARAAVSGGTGSATAQADAALRARLDGRLSVLADTAATPVGLPVDAVAPPPEPVTPGPEPSAAGVGAGSGALASGPMAASEPVPPSGVVPSSAVVPVSGVVPASGAASGADVPLSAPVEAPTPRLPSDVPPPAGPGALSTGAAAAPDALLTAAAPPGDPVTGGSPNGQPVGTAPSPALSSAGAAAMSPQATVSSVGGTVTAEPAVSSTGIPSSPVAPVPPAATAPGPSPSAPTTVASPSSVGGSAAPSAPPAAGLPAAPPAAGPSHTAPIGSSPPSATPTAARPASPGLPAPPVDPGPAGVEGLRPRTPEWYAATWAADRDAFERRRYRGHFAHQRTTHEENRRRERAAELRVAADRTLDEARWLVGQGRVLAYAGRHADAERYFREGRDRERWCHQQRDLAEAVLAGSAAPSVVGVGEQDFHRINDDVGDLATGGVETPDRSALTGDDHPPPIDRSRDYGRPGGLRPPLALHQTDVERQVPRDPDGRVTRTADPRRGGWFRLMNDGGPAADPTRGINCVDCALSLFDTWMHGRPRVAAPRTFDAYAAGNVNRPLHGEQHGPRRVEDVTGGRFQRLCQPDAGSPPGERRHAVDQGYRNLHDQLLLGGHGSYAFVINTWEGGGSHIWIALNQNGTVLYLDPQTGRVAPQPLYRHTGAAFAYNVVDLDVLVLGPDGRPMPMAGLRRGQFSVRPDLPDHPPATEHEGYGEPYVNRIHSLAGPGSAQPESDPPQVDAVLAHNPDLDENAARDLTSFFADPRVQRMLDDARQRPPQDEPLLAENLARQMAERPDLVRMMLATPELFDSLTSRPLTLHHLAGHQQAIDVLGEVLDEIAERGAAAVAATPAVPRPTPLAPEQRELIDVLAQDARAVQPGFDLSRCDDPSYQRAYLDRLYIDAVQAQAEVIAIAEGMASAASCEASAAGRPGPKARKRAEDKIRKYDGDASLLTDLAAAKVTFTTLDDLYAAFAELRSDPRLPIVEADDRFVHPQQSGYRDVQMMVRTTNGHVAELRLHLKAIDEVAEWEHALYEVRRDLRAVAKEQRRTMTSTEQAIFNGVLVREQAYFWRALQQTVAGRRADE